MHNINDFEFKQRKYLPVFPMATGKPTVYIEGFPYEDDEPMAATGFHAAQIVTFVDQLSRYFQIHEHIHIGVDTFVYYQENDRRKVVAPDVFVVLGVAKSPLRRSFYTWAEGAVPTTVFEFLSGSTGHQDRREKVGLYLRDIGVQEYFIHQPDMEQAAEFCGWRCLSGDIVEIEPDEHGGLFSASLNLRLGWEVQEKQQVRLLRPYLPDGTPITTSAELQDLKEAAETRAIELQDLKEAAETRAAEEARQRRELADELERLRAQLVNR